MPLNRKLIVSPLLIMAILAAGCASTQEPLRVEHFSLRPPPVRYDLATIVPVAAAPATPAEPFRCEMEELGLSSGSKVHKPLPDGGSTGKEELKWSMEVEPETGLGQSTIYLAGFPRGSLGRVVESRALVKACRFYKFNLGGSYGFMARIDLFNESLWVSTGINRQISALQSSEAWTASGFRPPPFRKVLVRYIYDGQNLRILSVSTVKQ